MQSGNENFVTCIALQICIEIPYLRKQNLSTLLVEDS